MGLVLLVMKNGMRQGKEQNFLINQKGNPKRMIGKLTKHSTKFIKIIYRDKDRSDRRKRSRSRDRKRDRRDRSRYVFFHDFMIY